MHSLHTSLEMYLSWNALVIALTKRSLMNSLSGSLKYMIWSRWRSTWANKITLSDFVEQHVSMFYMLYLWAQSRSCGRWTKIALRTMWKMCHLFYTVPQSPANNAFSGFKDTPVSLACQWATNPHLTALSRFQPCSTCFGWCAILSTTDPSSVGLTLSSTVTLHSLSRSAVQTTPYHFLTPQVHQSQLMLFLPDVYVRACSIGLAKRSCPNLDKLPSRQIYWPFVKVNAWDLLEKHLLLELTFVSAFLFRSWSPSRTWELNKCVCHLISKISCRNMRTYSTIHICPIATGMPNKQRWYWNLFFQALTAELS